ncbi:MAG: hypothetical protein P8184_12095 [Calditrichia bacterium]
MKSSHPFFHISIISILISLFFLLISLEGCAQAYRPRSNWELKEYSNSRLNIYPDEVRKNPEKFSDTQVAWAGIIKQSKFYKTSENIEVDLLLEHHYFDWHENKNAPPLEYYLSSRGEGYFKTRWFFKKDVDLQYIYDRYIPDNLAIVYGVPRSVDADTVIVASNYVRVINKKYYDADFYHYTPKDNNMGN